MLTSFTPLRYPPSGPEKPQRSPAIIIHNFSRVGFQNVAENLNDPTTAHDASPTQCVPATTSTVTATDADGTEYEENVEVKCTHENRYCSLYGLDMITCVCEFNPVSDIDLEELAQYCWFADREVDKMTNSLKRNMLYWWYMTNTYNICGSGNRKEPPACLKYAIRCKYSEPSGKYKVYVPGKAKGKKSKKRKVKTD